MIAKVKAHFVCFLQDEEGYHTVREFYYLENGNIYYRSNDIDSETRYYTDKASNFESKFRVNLLDYLSN